MKFFVHVIAGAWILLAAATGAIAQASGQGWLGILVAQATKDYKFFTKLDGPGRDINAAASAFSQIGFRTTVLTDPSKEQILEALKRAGTEGE